MTGSAHWRAEADYWRREAERRRWSVACGGQYSVADVVQAEAQVIAVEKLADSSERLETFIFWVVSLGIACSAALTYFLITG
jgi:hypothetical protein